MAEFIVSTHADSLAVGGADTSVTLRMPVLPLSAVIVHITAQITGSNNSDTWTTLLGALKSVQFRYRGSQVWGVSGLNLWRLARSLGVWGFRPEVYANTNNSVRQVSLCLPFGRQLFDPRECFPASNQGETELYLDWTAVPTGYNTLKYTVETLQLIDAAPSSFLRCTTITDTPSAAGDKDYDLPRAAPLVGLGYAMAASYPLAAAHTVERAKLLANNQDYMYANVKTDTLRAFQGLSCPLGLEMDTVVHTENTAGAYAQNASTQSNRLQDSAASAFAWLPFDPWARGDYLVQAQQFQDFKLRLTFNTAAQVQLLPLELWTPDMLRKPGSVVASGAVPARR